MDWVCRNGTITNIEDMDISHMRNALRYFKKLGWNPDEKPTIVDELNAFGEVVSYWLPVSPERHAALCYMLKIFNAIK